MTGKKTSAKKATAVTAGTRKKRPPKAPPPSWTLARLARDIRERAYFIWENEGCPEEADFNIWLRAERETFAAILK